jgi:hypothetical protein
LGAFFALRTQGIALRQFPACEAPKMRPDDWKNSNAGAGVFLTL